MISFRVSFRIGGSSIGFEFLRVRPKCSVEDLVSAGLLNCELLTLPWLGLCLSGVSSALTSRMVSRCAWLGLLLRMELGPENPHGAQSTGNVVTVIGMPCCHIRDMFLLNSMEHLGPECENLLNHEVLFATLANSVK